MTCDEYRRTLATVSPASATKVLVAATISHGLECKACRDWRKEIASAAEVKKFMEKDVALRKDIVRIIHEVLDDDERVQTIRKVLEAKG